MPQDPQVCFRCDAEFRDDFVGAAWKRGRAQGVLLDFAKKWMDAYKSGHVLKLEQKHVCPVCGSITYAVCEHAAKALLGESVPKAENKTQKVKNGLELLNDPVVAAATSLELRPWITMLVDVLKAGGEDAETFRKMLKIIHGYTRGETNVMFGSGQADARAQKHSRRG